MLYLFSLALTGLTFFLILAGGLVTSHDAGLAVPDWPLSYGRYFPPMVGNIFWEHGHRMIAGTVGILTLLFAIAVHISEKRAWVKTLSRVAVLTVITQALLGGLTVIYLLPAPVSIFHACLAQTFLCLVTSMAFFLSPQFSAPHPAYDAKFQRTAVMTVIFVFVQLVLGATVRHTHFWIPVWLHVFFALGVVAHVFMLARRASQLPVSPSEVFAPTMTLGILVIVQVLLGIGALVFTRFSAETYSPSQSSIMFATAHQTTGAMILALSVLTAVMVKR